MSSCLKELISLLTEQVLVEQDAKDPKAPFGRWLFGPEQKNKQAQQEPNTQMEDELKKLMGKHYGGYLGKKSLDKNREALGSFLLKYVKPEIEKGNYSNYLAPKNTTVYRGMNIAPDLFAKLVKMKKEDILNTEDRGKGWYLDYKGILKANSPNGTMSWTSDFKKAAQFAHGKKNTYVVLVAKTSDSKNNFFINPDKTKGAFKNNSFFNKYDYEKEIISVGPVHFDEVVFWIKPKTWSLPLSSDQKRTKDEPRDPEQALAHSYGIRKNAPGPWD